MKIEILGKPDCEGCEKSKALFKEQGIVFDFYSIKDRGRSRLTEIKKDMFVNSRETMLPAFYVNGEYVGFGFDVAQDIAKKF